MRPTFDNEQNLVSLTLDDTLNAGQINGSEEGAVVRSVINKQTNPDTVENLKSSLSEQTISEQKRHVGRPRKNVDFQSYHGNSDTSSYQKKMRKKKRNRNHFTNEQRIQVAKYSIANGNAQATDYFFQMYGKSIAPYTVAHLKKCYLNSKENTSGSNNDINFDLDRAIKKRRHRKRITVKSSTKTNQINSDDDIFTDAQKSQIAVYALNNGTDKTVKHFSKLYDQPLPADAVEAIKCSYSNEDRERHTGVSKVRKRNPNYTSEQRIQMAEYSIKYGVTKAVEYFSKLFGRGVPEGTISVYKSLYRKKEERDAECAALKEHHYSAGDALIFANDPVTENNVTDNFESF